MRYFDGKDYYRSTIYTLTLVAIIFLSFLIISGSVLAATDSVTRLAGEDRWETSANVALDAYPDGAVNVIIARGDNKGQWADGLAGGYLAGVLDAPILLTATGSLDEKVIEAIKALDPDKAYILGGTVAVSAGVEAELKGLGLEIERIAGADREATAALIAAEGKVNDNTAFIAQGRAPADSMVAGAAAFAKSYPILLVNKNSVPDVTASAITSLGIKNIIIVGGEAVVSAGVEAELSNIAGVTSITRLAGLDRVATSVAFAENQFSGSVDFSIVNGRRGLADAVGAAVFGNPILYVNSIPEAVQNHLDTAVTYHSILRIFGGPVVVSAEVGSLLTQLVDEAPPGPQFTVFPKSDIWGERWKANTEIAIEIYDGVETEVYYRNSDATGHFQLQFDDTFNIQAGHVVRINDGVTKRSHTVRHCTITSVNIETDKVYGEAEPGRLVEVGIHHGPNIYVEADNQGNWEVDFSGIHDIVDGDWTYAFVFDSLGNATGYEWVVTKPFLGVNPETNVIYGFNLICEAVITITVDGVEYTTQAGEGGYGWITCRDFRFEHDDLDVQAGNVITVTDGVTTMEHTVTNILITTVDYENDDIIGTAESGSEVIVAIWADQRIERHETAEGGNWTANFSVADGDEPWQQAHDIREFDAGSATQFDEHGNYTTIHWQVPVIRATVDGNNTIIGYGWACGTEITITGGATYTTFAGTGLGGEPLEDCGEFWYEDAGLEVIAEGKITVTDGIVTKELDIVNLVLTEINPAEDTISGTADVGIKIVVHVGSGEDWFSREVTADGGTWIVDFSESVGDEPWEQSHNITSGDEVWVQHRDEYGDATTYIKMVN